MDAREVIRNAAVRTAMEDARCFVGRSLEQRRLESAKVAWIFGPARIGKSSLARRLCERAGPGSLVVVLDASDLGPGDFDRLLGRALNRAAHDVSPGGDVRAAFAALAESSRTRSVRVVFDEFDRLAMNLGEQEQTFLRKLAHEHAGFSLVVSTRLDPASLVEEFPTPSSRLLGISIQQLLPALERRHVFELFKRIAEDLDRSDFSRWATIVWERVGGHPVSVMTLAHALVCQELEEPLDDALALDTIERRHEEVRTQLVSLWGDLKLGTRSFLLASPQDAGPEHRLQAKLDGYCSERAEVRPQWLVEVGKKYGVVAATVPSFGGADGIWARAQRLDELIYSINVKVKRLGGRDFFETTNESNARYILTRAVATVQDFGNVVGHLHKRLYESACDENPQTRWRIPGPVTDGWKDSSGLKRLCVLRNHLSHDQNHKFTRDQANTGYDRYGDVLRDLCGDRAPERVEVWCAARDALIDDLIRGLEATDLAAGASALSTKTPSPLPPGSLMPIFLRDRIAHIRALTLDARHGEALQALYEFTQEVAPDESARIMPSVAAHKHAERNYRAGTLSEADYRVELARFVQAIEALLRDLERRVLAVAPAPPPAVTPELPTVPAVPTVDFAILTIREDEHAAVLQRFPDELDTVSRHRRYRRRRIQLTPTESYTVGVLRTAEQGGGEALDATRDVIEDLKPRFILVVGIAGGVPSSEFSLGDVVVSTRIVDFSVEAVLGDHSREYALAGGPLHPEASKLAADISGMTCARELGDWNTEASIAKPRPPVVLSDDKLYGDDAWKNDVRSKLAHHFEGKPARPPKVTTGAIGASDRLIKDAEILQVWLKVARQIQAVEMESAGVYRAAHGKHVPFLAIRGISDVVGFKRHPDWTEYACHSAAAFARAFLLARPIPPPAGAAVM
jgi:nucleoside phosphorylase